MSDKVDMTWGGKLCAHMNPVKACIECKLQRIDEELVGSYGEIETMRASDVRRILRNIADIVHPSASK